MAWITHGLAWMRMISDMSAQEYADRYLVETVARFLRRKSISKDFMKTIITLLLGLGVSLFAEATKPNIVVIISDDQAWTDYGFMGHPTIKTPHLDKLARRSLLFERGYVAAPLCRPSLASMATGLYPFQHGVAGNDVDGRNNRAALDMPVREAFHKHPSFKNKCR